MERLLLAMIAVKILAAVYIQKKIWFVTSVRVMVDGRMTSDRPKTKVVEAATLVMHSVYVYLRRR
jgi:hypothetical protein